MQIRENDPLVDQIQATLRTCIATITAWADDPTPTTPHEAAMAQCMTALAGINNQLTERLGNARKSTVTSWSPAT